MNPALELTWDMFVESPSRRDGISMALEKYYRVSGCEFIGALSARFTNKIRGRIVCHACALYNQFYMRRSFKSFDRWEVAVAALSVATKNKGTTHCLRELIVESLKLWRQRKGLVQEDKQDKLFADRVKYWESVIFRLELEILITLNGELGVLIAHAYLSSSVTELIRDTNGKTLTPDNQKEILKKVVTLFKYSYRSVMTLFYPASWIVAANLYWAIELENKHWEMNSLKVNGNGNNSNHNHSHCQNSTDTHMTGLLRPLQLQKDWYKHKHFGARLDMSVIEYLVNEFKACMTAEENNGVVPKNSFMVQPFSSDNCRDTNGHKQDTICTNGSNIHVEPKANGNNVINKNDQIIPLPNIPSSKPQGLNGIVTKEYNSLKEYNGIDNNNNNNNNNSNTQNGNSHAAMNAVSSTYQRQSTSETHKSCTSPDEWILFNATNKSHSKCEEASQLLCNNNWRKRKLFDMQTESEPKQNMENKGSLEHMFASPLKKVKTTINSLTIMEESNAIMHHSRIRKQNPNTNTNTNFNNHMDPANANPNVGLVSLLV